MTGSHEVRGSIPLGSTNKINSLGPPFWWPLSLFGDLTATLAATRKKQTLLSSNQRVHSLGSVSQHFGHNV
jgi:hypothetical protein